MMTETIKPKQSGQQDPAYVINPKKFVLWLIIVASVMLFAAFTSAYIVRRGEGNWLLFDLPGIFLYNTIVIALSSASMQTAYFMAKRDEIGRLKILLSTTFLLGTGFAIGQWIGWKQLVEAHIYLAGNPSESFLYVISAVHLLHMFGGLVFVAAIIFQTFRFKVHKKSLLGINLCTTYWHFLGALWVYLYFFFLLNR